MPVPRVGLHLCGQGEQHSLIGSLMPSLMARLPHEDVEFCLSLSASVRRRACSPGLNCAAIPSKCFSPGLQCDGSVALLPWAETPCELGTSRITLQAPSPGHMAFHPDSMQRSRTG